MTAILPPGTAGAFRRRMTPEPERPPITDPVQWTRETLDEHPWSVQREVMRAVVEHRRTAVPACHGSGKSYMAARVAAWWIASHPIGEAFVVTSAPLQHQVKAIVWRELHRAHRLGNLPGRIVGLTGNGPVEWYVGEELVAFGRKPADLADADQARQQFQGIHAPFVLVILDEATGVPEWLWQAAQSLLTNPDARMLAIGNPDDPSSHFADVCKPGSGWHVRHISAFETPAFTGELVPEVVRRGLVSREWVEEAERDYGGSDNPLYVSKVTGQFPDRSDDLVVSPRLVRDAWMLELPGRARGAYGLDVSRSPTGDWTALYRQRGGVARLVDTWRGLPITAKPGEPSTVDRTWGHVKPNPAVPIVVDVDGLGAGAFDGLAALDTARPVPFSAAGPARRPDRFDSRRSELWWEFRKRMEARTVDLDESDEVLAAQLQTPKWWVVGGRIHVETKAELKRRGKPSPDRADAVIMATIGEPIELGELGELGERVPYVPPPSSKPGALRVRGGEVASMRTRPM